MGLYIARIFDEVRARPVYVVSELVGQPFGPTLRKTPQRESNYKSNYESVTEFNADPKTPSTFKDNLNYISEQSTDQVQ